MIPWACLVNLLSKRRIRCSLSQAKGGVCHGATTPRGLPRACPRSMDADNPVEKAIPFPAHQGSELEHGPTGPSGYDHIVPLNPLLNVVGSDIQT